MSEEKVREFGPNGEYVLPSGKEVVLRKIGINAMVIAQIDQNTNDMVQTMRLIQAGVKSPLLFCRTDWIQPTPEGMIDFDEFCDFKDQQDLAVAVSEFSGIKAAIDVARPTEATEETTITN